MEPENKDIPTVTTVESDRPNGRANKNDRHKWVASLESILEYILKNEQSEQATSLVLEELIERLRESGINMPHTVSTPYINTIPPEKEPPYPGNREIERRIKSYVRWNAMAMVVNANRLHPDVGGHISTYASSATLYEVASNHFFRGGDGDDHPATWFIFRAMPRRATMRARFSNGASTRPSCIISARNFPAVGGVSSYPHPYLMPDFWQFPTVSMGLAPIMSIYQARFIALSARAVVCSAVKSRAVWCFIGDGEMDEPESLGRAHARGARESRQSHLGRQLQSAAARWPGSRQRQNYSGARSALSRRGLECHQSHLGFRLGSAVGAGR